MTIDICILVGRETANLRRLLVDIEGQETAPHLVIVVVDCSRGGEMPSGSWLSKIPTSLLRHDGRHRQPEMRNRALAESAADYIWFIDDDVALAPDVMTRLRTVLTDLESQRDIGCIAGRVVEARSYDPTTLPFPIGIHWYRGPVGYFGAVGTDFSESRYSFRCGLSGNRYPVIDVAQGTSMIFRREALMQIGGFNEILGVDYAFAEDSEPCLAIGRRGWSTVYAEGVEVTHLKLQRTDGSSRETAALKSTAAQVRNHTITLLANGYPGALRARLYACAFAVASALRFVRTCRSPQQLLLAMGTLTKAAAEGVRLSKQVQHRRDC